MRILVVAVVLLYSLRVNATVELKSNFLPSLAAIPSIDAIFSSHNTLLFGFEWFYLGAYASFETISQSVTDSSYGGAIRFGNEYFLELQGGPFERRFRENGTNLTGKGFAANLLFGHHFNDYFGLSLMAVGKRIESGMNRRFIADLVPYLSLRVAY